MNIIIEGLTGAGKSQIISQLKKISQENILDQYEIIYENDTFGELLAEIKEKKTDKEKLFRLNNCLDKIRKGSGKFILERFHFSYYPFINNWELYREIDQELKDLNFMLILLTYQEELLEERAVKHRDVLNSTGSKALIEYFGSLEKAISAYKESQGKRIECLKYTKLPYVEIDTSEMKWQNYVGKILETIKLKAADITPN
jgi:thymidylate kinase